MCCSSISFMEGREGTKGRWLFLQLGEGENIFEYSSICNGGYETYSSVVIKLGGTKHIGAGGNRGV